MANNDDMDNLQFQQLMGRDDQSGSALKKLLIYSIMMMTLPIALYFASKSFIFEAMFGMSSTNSYFYAAIVAILAVHVVLGLFIYAAYVEGTKTYKAPYKAE